jgi:hypothetical protein
MTKRATGSEEQRHSDEEGAVDDLTQLEALEKDAEGDE